MKIKLISIIFCLILSGCLGRDKAADNPPIPNQASQNQLLQEQSELGTAKLGEARLQ